MAKKKMKFKKYIGFLYIGIALVMIYTLAINFTRVQERKHELANLTEQRDTLLKEKEKLEKEVSQLSDSDYVIRWAREHYIFSKDGEEIATLPESKK